MNRVFITGIGVVSPIGNSVDTFWRHVRQGVSGAGPITRFDASGFPVRFAAEVKDFQAELVLGRDRRTRNLPLPLPYALAAAAEAIDRARLDVCAMDPHRAGIVAGTGAFLPDPVDFAAGFAAASREGEPFDPSLLAERAGCVMHPLWLLRYLPNMIIGHLSRRHGFRGPGFCLNTACSTGTQAIGEAFRMVQAGRAEVVLAGASDSRVSPFGILGYETLGVLSHRNDDPARASRPFDADRDGFLVGEGAAWMVVESEASAAVRGVSPLAEITGFAATLDGYSLADPDPTASEPAAAIRQAMAEASLEASDVDCINTHGTSTRKNDRAEAAAIRLALGEEQAIRVPCHALKSMVGHLVAAAGALEIVAAVCCLRDQVLFPTINYETPDPDCPLDVVPNRSRAAALRNCLCLSLGFGGQNACLVLRATASGTPAPGESGA